MRVILIKSIYYISILAILFFLYFFYKSHESKKQNVIYIENIYLSENFKINIPNESNQINEYLKSFSFISNFKVHINNGGYKIDIKINKPFAISSDLKKIIFENGSIQESNLFTNNFINSINLIYKNINSIEASIHTINLLKEIEIVINFNSIEYIDNRRYDLYIPDGRKVMLPKLINTKLINFLKKNYNFISTDDNFISYLDLRNFHHDAIRMK